MASASRLDRPPATGVPVPGAKAGIEAVDVEGQVGRRVADDLADAADDA